MQDILNCVNTLGNYLPKNQELYAKVEYVSIYISISSNFHSNHKCLVLAWNIQKRQKLAKKQAEQDAKAKLITIPEGRIWCDDEMCEMTVGIYYGEELRSESLDISESLEEDLWIYGWCGGW